MEDKINQIEFILDDLIGLPVRKAFLGVCLGVVLRNRMKLDPHVVLTIVAEESPGQWVGSFSNDGSFSSYWIQDLQNQMELVQKWMQDNCESDNDMGWKFKENFENEY